MMIKPLDYLHNPVHCAHDVRHKVIYDKRNSKQKSHSNCYAICLRLSQLTGACLPSAQGYFIKVKLDMLGEISRPLVYRSSYTLQ